MISINRFLENIKKVLNATDETSGGDKQIKALRAKLFTVDYSDFHADKIEFSNALKAAKETGSSEAVDLVEELKDGQTSNGEEIEAIKNEELKENKENKAEKEGLNAEENTINTATTATDISDVPASNPDVDFSELLNAGGIELNGESVSYETIKKVLEAQAKDKV